MAQHQYELLFDIKDEVSLRKDEDIKPLQRRNFLSYPDTFWGETAHILIDEIRKLKPGEELTFLMLGRRLGEPGQGMVICVDQDQTLGINILLDEIIRLQELRKTKTC